MPDAPDLHQDILVKYLQTLGVTPETTKAIRDEVREDHVCVLLLFALRQYVMPLQYIGGVLVTAFLRMDPS